MLKRRVKIINRELEKLHVIVTRGTVLQKFNIVGFSREGLFKLLDGFIVIFLSMLTAAQTVINCRVVLTGVFKFARVIKTCYCKIILSHLKLRYTHVKVR